MPPLLNLVDNTERLQALQRIAVALLQTRHKSEILSLIVNEAMNLIACDAGSLYLKHDERTLNFEVAVNQSLRFDFKQHRVPILGPGIAAHCFRSAKPLIIPDVYELPDDLPYRFDKSFDRMANYRTRSMLVQPLISSKKETVGVLQLINRKHRPTDEWRQIANHLDAAPGFTDDDADFLQAFSSLAAAAIENSILYENIEQLFEGFVHASVKAIESRDPVTRGHSERVALLTTELAENVRRCPNDAIRVDFNPSQISEIRYAALLHDFGKLGVSEATLLKSEKLFPEEKERIRARFDSFVATHEIMRLRELISRLAAEKRAPHDIEIARIKKECVDFANRIENYWSALLDLNRPSVLDEAKGELLKSLSGIELPVLMGDPKKLLEVEEIGSLAIIRGSLSNDQRLEIESHVAKTYEFLKDIPWGREFRNLPHIAFSHHEKLDGSGYPRKLKGDEIPPQSRLLAICDIFDALVAPDRPYKAAVPMEKALAILDSEARAGKLDKTFLSVFHDAKVYEMPQFLKMIQPPSPTGKKTG